MPLPHPPRAIRSVAAVALVALGALGAPARADPPPALAAWLRPVPGTVARVDVAPWLDSDEPEAALVASPGSLRRDFSADGTRPADVVYEPIGVRVRLVRALPGGIFEVRAVDGTWRAYAPQNRVLPEIPRGAALRVAGGFDGAADFYPSLATPQAGARTLVAGTPLAAIETAAAPFDPDSSDLVRVRVRVVGGRAAGTTGWIAIAYVGTPEAAPGPRASIVARACRCRPVRFLGVP